MTQENNENLIPSSFQPNSVVKTEKKMMTEEEVVAKERKDSNDRDKRVAPFVRFALETIISSKYDIESDVLVRKAVVEDEIYSKLIGKMLEDDIQINDVSYVFQLLHAVIDDVKAIVDTNVALHFTKADEMVYGKESRLLTFKDVDNILKKGLTK